MPPKKRRRVINPESKLGVAQRYVSEHFGSFPTAAADVRNGHVLHVYMSSGEYSRTQCDKQLKTLIVANLGLSADHDFKTDIKRVVSNSLDKYRRLCDPKELSKFVAACEEPFTVTVAPSTPPNIDDDDHILPGPNIDLHDAGAGPNCPPDGVDDFCILPELSTNTSHELNSPEPWIPRTPASVATAQPTPTTSSSITRSQSAPDTPRKQILKRRLKYMSDSISKVKKKYQSEIKALKESQKTPKRVVNQALQRKLNIISRKDAKIKELQEQLSGNKLAKELAQTKSELDRLKIAHKKLKTYHRSKAKNSISTTVPKARHQKVLSKLKDKEETIKYLEHKTLLLKEEIEETRSIPGTNSKVDSKTYSPNMRMKVYDCIINKVPTANIPPLLKKLQERNKEETESVPQRSAVELMARELGVIAELQTAEIVMETKNVTLGFDATTQDHLHVNSIHFTTENQCVAAAVDELPGGTAEDYAHHICETVNNLSQTYTHFHEDSNYQDVRKQIIENISNTITDRCASNHAAIRIVNSEWNKTLTELNCHLHPLESIASGVRTAIRKLEETRGKVFGKDCLAGNVIIQINKLRYKNGKGDPRGFVAFLDEHNLPRGILPRYCGNRLHVLFHIAGKLIEHYDLFVSLFSIGISCGGLRSALLNDFKNDTTILELRILGLLGKLLTGPWMKRFYTSSQTEINHITGIQVARNVIAKLKVAVENSESLVLAKEDFFGDKITASGTWTKLTESPVNQQFGPMMKTCLEAVIAVLERQYSRYYDIDTTEKLKQETASARSHNMDAEELMGMFSASKQKAPNVTMCYPSCRMCASKNKTVDYLDNLEEEQRERILQKVIKFARVQRNNRKVKQRELRAELIRREKVKEHTRDTKERKKLEKKLKDSNLDDVQKDYPNLDYSKIDELQDILAGKAVGKKACHVWSENGKLIVYNAKIEKWRATKKIYKVAYWCHLEEYDNATDHEMSMYSLAADLLYGDLVFC